MQNHTGMTDSDAKRFWAKVDKTDTCWLWTATKIPAGYGHFHLNGRMQKAHRVAYQMETGPVDQELDVDHRCHNKACVRPSHLRAATHAQNLQNRRGATSRSKSGVRGVYWSKSAQRWRVSAWKDGRPVSGGQFVSIEEAEAAAIALRNRLFTFNEADRKAA